MDIDGWIWVFTIALTLGAAAYGVVALCEGISRCKRAKRAVQFDGVLAQAQAVATAEDERLAAEAARTHYLLNADIERAIATIERILDADDEEEGEA